MSRPSLATLALVGLALAGIWRWQLQPRARAEAARDAELDATLASIAQVLDATPLARSRPLTLRWAFDDSCTQVYELAVDEHFAHEGVAIFLGRDEEHARYRLAIGPHARVPGRRVARLDRFDDDAGASPQTRELFESDDGRGLGPRAPDLACRNRTWDPLEDALALGWPTLPERPAWPGEAWVGDVVGGRCHETVCLDAAGQFDHARSCQAAPWREQLAGVALGGSGEPSWGHPRSPQTIAVLRSRWDDGHEHEGATIGITTTRELAIAEGQLVLARAEIDQRWSGVVRRLELRRVEACAAP